MKAFLTVFAVLALTVLLLGCVSHEECEQNNKKYVAVNHSYMKAMWLSQYDLVNIYTNGGSQRDKNDFEKRIEGILDNVVSLGINTVIVQVRPCNDAFYPSRFSPWSRYLSGVEGYALEKDFDPLAFMIAEARRNGLAFHAWLNPYRVTNRTKLTKEAYLRTLHPSNYAAKNPDKVLSVPLSTGGNMLFLNPGEPDVLLYLLNSIQELLRYKPDAIHIDDYFYPYEPMQNQDVKSFLAHGKPGMTIADFRRYSTDRLVQSIMLLIRRYNTMNKTNIQFGVSPFGIWANKPRPKPQAPDALAKWLKLETSPYGSETKGHQSYFELYADTRKWVQNGWVDYITPQVYWGFSNPVPAVSDAAYSPRYRKG